ncbi:winged helix-turn-helix domain-containing protein [Pseudoduganella sp. UC29_106]|uniref:winged helix-turn-helix domain-containing protein n=1 Tax=Pseudoduganella sp. UC29_106 TaxID=3374553 RepID=UPI00375647DA
MAADILIIDSDLSARQLLTLNLGHAGYAARAVGDAESALPQLDAMLPDVLVLEWDLPGQSGLSLIRQLRATRRSRDLPIIMLSARNAEQDKVLALESGADDYISKPFSPRETLARLHALLRRRRSAALADAADALEVADLRLDPATLRVSAGSRQISMGRIEFRLLNFLMHHPGRVHTRAQLLDQVWGNAVYLDERTVDAHVGRLRSALQPSGHHAHIETVRGSGYRFKGTAWSS